MSQSVLLQPAYVLHARSYRDTSLLLELFTHEYGRISTVAKGAKGIRSRFKGLLQPFVPLLVSWYGKTELMTLMAAEADGAAPFLKGDALLCGLYLNELLIHLLHRYDAHPGLYQAYQQTLTLLPQKISRQTALRQFEKQLLAELGYALQLDRIAQTNDRVISENSYYFDPSQGVLPCVNGIQVASHRVFSGEVLLAIQQNAWTEVYLQDAKRLLRLALGHLLGNKLVKSRELFV